MTLNKRINLIIFFGIFFTFLISISLSFILIKKIAYNKFMQKLTLIGNEISKTSTISLLLHDIKLMKDRVDTYIKDKDISGITIFDKSNKIIYSNGKIGEKYIDFPIILKFNVSQLEEKKEKILGIVRIYYTETYFEKELLKIFIIILLISISGLVIISFIIYYVLQRALNDPLKRLMHLIQIIKKGNFNVKMEIKGAPEIIELANTFQDMAESLNQKNIELKKTYELMAEHKTLAELGKFAMIVAHEIKNPLGIIKGASQVFKKAEVDEETKKEMLLYIEDEVKRLDNLVKDFMAISKTKNPELKEINIKNFIQNLSEKLKLMFPEIDIIIDYKCEKQEKYTDIELLTQIISNLIKNSVEANANKINIYCFEENNKWCINIKDNGNGIPENELDKIFEPFFTKKTKGTGLGLVIVNNYVKLLKGNISVKSEVSVGTEFKICFAEDIDG